MIAELRRYQAAPGKADALRSRFAAVTLPLFAKLGIHITGFWTERDDPSVLLYTCTFADEAARTAAWAAFDADPTWQAAKTASEADGKLVLSLASTVMIAIPEFVPA